MAITAVGFDGTVDEAAFSRMLTEGGSAYGPFCSVASGDPDYAAGKVTAKPGGTREVNVSTFASTGFGVRVTVDAVVTKQSDVVASGTRWDLICLRRNWSGMGGIATVEIVKGTSLQQIPAGANKAAAAGAGLDDQPIALVQYTAGQTAPTSIVDLRSWPSKVIRADSLLAVAKTFGAVVSVGGYLYGCELVSGALTWVRLGSTYSTYSATVASTPTIGTGEFSIVLPPGTLVGSTAADIVSVQFTPTGYAGVPAYAAFLVWSKEYTTLTKITGKAFLPSGAPASNTRVGFSFTVTTKI